MAPHGRSVLIVLVSLARTGQGHACNKRPGNPRCLRAALDRATQTIYLEPPLSQPALPVRQVTGLVTLATGAFLGSAFYSQVVPHPPQVPPAPEVLPAPEEGHKIITSHTPRRDVGNAAGSLGVLVGFAAYFSLRRRATKRTPARTITANKAMARTITANKAMHIPMEGKAFMHIPTEGKAGATAAHVEPAASPGSSSKGPKTPPGLGTGQYERQVSVDEPQPELEPERSRAERRGRRGSGRREHEVKKMALAISRWECPVGSTRREQIELKTMRDHDWPVLGEGEVEFHRICTEGSEEWSQDIGRDHDRPLGGKREVEFHRICTEGSEEWSQPSSE